ncbi:TRAP transporter substrate-binding protein DctP [Halobellus rarus]|uniref:TRAP transporter substrate-binding protein DctP n=1 Tax=Halobellus rarus TaxID=1126237 RepID=A0ABD6CR95_9EURY
MRLTTRRSYLKGAGASTIIGLAGCLDGSNTSESSNGNEETSSAVGTTESNESVTLTVSEFLPKEGATAENGIREFKRLVEERTDNQVKLDITYGAQMGPPGDQTSLVRGKTVDMASTLPAYESETLPLSNIVNIPATFDRSETVEAAKKFFDMLSSGILLEQEYNSLNIQPVMCNMSTPYQLGTSEKKISTTDDWDGYVVRSPGATASIGLNALGASPQEMSGPDAYQALTRGTVDGVIVFLNSLYNRDFYEALSYATTNAHLGTFGVVYSMNQEVFNELSDERQQILLEAGKDASVNFAEGTLEQDENAVPKLQENGVETYELPEDTLTEWGETMLEAISNQWLKQMSNDSANEVWEEWTNYWK